MNTLYYEAGIALENTRTPYVSVTMINVVGSAPQTLGAKMLVTPEGLYAGTVGGGKIEAFCIQAAQTFLKAPPTERVLTKDYNLQTDIGMTCGGVVTMLFEIVLPFAWSIAVFGAGHVSQALVPLLCTLEAQVYCIEKRAEWLDRLPDHPRLIKLSPTELKDALSDIPSHAMIVSMTMGHAHDVPILEQALLAHSINPKHYPFIGVIGSAAKAGAIKRDLKKLGLSKEEMNPLICPVGLPLGNNTPPEIALSIGAQLLQVRDAIFGTHQKWKQKNASKNKE